MYRNFILSFLLGFTFTLPALSKVSVELLSKEAQANIHKVPEFAFIQETAAKMGVKVYLFGGSAAAYAHYVRWDLERKSGSKIHQPERFDYDFTNIYRGNQDLDLVVDGTARQAYEIQELLQKTYPHFVGDKQSWEVRLLRDSIGDKRPLLDDPDFKNQHTDTNSTGMLDLTATETEPVFRDLLDWENKKSQFLNDVASAKITYLFNKNHDKTHRYKEGKNPPIFSAVRYLAKLTQYEVKGTKKDLKKIKEIINKTDFFDLSDYVRFKLSEFGIKTLLNSPNSEYAWNLMEELGLREKLIQMDGSRFYDEESLSWWLNKEPLRTKEFGTEGKTARELFGNKDIIVSHETNSFLAYENITRSSRGEANAFISRYDAVGEYAAFGDGFYTRLGTQGARGTGLTIRFKLHPQARQGHDFTVDGDFIIITNKKALILIQENINISMIDFLKLSHSGEISRHDKGLSEKFLRKFKRTNPESDEFQEALRFVENQLSVSDDLPEELLPKNILAGSSLSFDQLFKTYTGGVEKYYTEFIVPSLDSHFDFWIANPKLVKKIIKKDIINSALIEKILPHPSWLKHPSVILELIESDRHYFVVIKHILSKEKWMQNKKVLQAILEKAAGSTAIEYLAEYVFSSPYWHSHPETVLDYASQIQRVDSFFEHVFSDPYWVKHDKIILKFVEEHPRHREFLLKYVFKNQEWSHHVEFLDSLLQQSSSYNAYIIDYFFGSPKWLRHNEISDHIFEWSSENELLPAMIAKIEEFPFLKEQTYFIDKILSQNKSSNLNLRTSFFIKHIEKKGTEKHLDLMTRMLQAKGIENLEQVLRKILDTPHWKKHAYSLFLELASVDDSTIHKALINILFKSHNLGPDAEYEIFTLIAEHSKSSSLLAVPYVFKFDDFEKKKTIVSLMVQSRNQQAFEFLATSVFPYAEWLQTPSFIEFLIKGGSLQTKIALVKNVFSQDHWTKFPELLEKLISQPNTGEIKVAIARHVFTNPAWTKSPELMRQLIRSRTVTNELVTKVISNSDFWINHKEVITDLINNIRSQEFLIEHIFLNPKWIYDESIFKLFFSKLVSKEKPLKTLIENNFFAQNPELLVFVVENTTLKKKSLWQKVGDFFIPDLVGLIILKEYLSKKENTPHPEVLIALIKRDSLNKKIEHDLFIQKYWKEHHELKAFLNGQNLTIENILKRDKTQSFTSWVKNYRSRFDLISCQKFLSH